MFRARTKHMKVHYHYVRKCLYVRDIDLMYVPTQSNVADIFTKALPREKFEAFRKALRLLPCYTYVSLQVRVHIIRSKGVWYTYVSLE
jgi:hypothetical protein